ncbi:MAG: PmoA family protein [Planctomycetaceae bacterium]|nr:PmoA family protein [Planctomycetaceae bacterium]
MHHLRFAVLSISLISMTTVFFCETGRADETSLLWTAETYLKKGMPIHINIAKSGEGPQQLIEAETGTVIPLQKQGDQWIGLLPSDVKKEETLDFQLSPVTETDAPDNAVQCSERDGRVVITNRGREVLHYRAATVEPPEGEKGVYRRSGYIHPLFAPYGKEITGDFAQDHPHQHGIMFAWTNASFQGRKVDFWNQAAGLGRIEHREIVKMTSGPVFAELVVKIAHVDLTSGKPIDVLNEQWTIRVYDAGETDEFKLFSYIIDFESVQEAATEEPLKILEYHYGGFAIRGNEAWLGREPDLFLTSSGKNRENGNHSRPEWCRMAGQLNLSSASVLIAPHKDNFRAPAPVRLHPAKPYFCFAPLVLGDFEISKEQPLRSRYRIVSSMLPQEPGIAEMFTQNFSNPVELGKTEE